MRDSEVVAAIVAGDPAGLAEAYDRYAAALHAYCRTLLTEPADAADAVQDTFLIAASKLAGLREPDRPRPWLYAVARNECHRRLRGHAQTAGLDEAADLTDESADVAVDVERDDLRELVEAAIAGLNAGEREIIELNLRHELNGSDLADALGVSLKNAQALASRARRQLEISLGALLVARGGQELCPELGALLDGWDGRLTVLLRKRINRHIEHCGVCGERRRHELRPAMLLGLLPLVALPDGLRHQVLSLVSDASPDSAAYHAHVLQRAAPFGKSGFPVQIDPAGVPRARARQVLTTGAGFAALAVAGAVVGTVLFHTGPLAPRHGAHANPPAATRHQPGSPGSGPGSGLGPGPGTSPGPALAAPGPTPVVVATGQPGTAPPTWSASGTATPGPSGTLTASPTSVTLVLPVIGGPSGSFTLTAHGGPVAYTVTVPAQYAGVLTVSPQAGWLAGAGAGQSVKVRVTLQRGYGPLVTTLTVEPGALSVAVVYVQL